MFNAIVRWFGWDKPKPARSTLAAVPGRLPAVGRAAQSGPRASPGAPVVPVNGHDKSGTAGSEKKVEPAMAVIPRDAVQMPPQAAAPGLPPVDPVRRPMSGMTNAAGAAPNRSSGWAPTVVPPPESTPPIPPANQLGNKDCGTGKPNEEHCRTQAAWQGVAPGGNGLPSGGREPTVNPAIDGKDRPIDREEERDLSPSMDFFDDLTVAYGLSVVPAAATAGAPSMDCSLDEARLPNDAPVAARVDPRPPGPGIDDPARSGVSRAGEPAGRGSRIPPRIADRPGPEDWNEDELLTLPEAAALFWPAGPITTNTLRTAGRDGTLAITKVAGKFFTTPMAIRRMGVADDGGMPDPAPARTSEISPQALFAAKLEEARRQGRDRKRRQRAAKRSVASLDKGPGR